LLQPLASSSKDLIGLLLASKMVPEFLAFYKTRKFISIYITALHWTLSWVRRIKFTLSPNISSVMHCNINLDLDKCHFYKIYRSYFKWASRTMRMQTYDESRFEIPYITNCIETFFCIHTQGKLLTWYLSVCIYNDPKRHVHLMGKEDDENCASLGNRDVRDG